MKAKALSIRQPWTWAILYAGKMIENREWYTKFRGEFYIHSSKQFDYQGYTFLKSRRDCLAQELPEIEGFLVGKYPGTQRGGIVGKAKLIDVISFHYSFFFSGPWGFVLSDIEPIDFIPMKGNLKFFNINIGENNA